MSVWPDPEPRFTFGLIQRKVVIHDVSLGPGGPGQPSLTSAVVGEAAPGPGWEHLMSCLCPHRRPASGRSTAEMKLWAWGSDRQAGPFHLSPLHICAAFSPGDHEAFAYDFSP